MVEEKNISTEKYETCLVCGKQFKNLASHMKAHKDSIPDSVEPVQVKREKINNNIVIKNVLGEEVSPNDYFYNGIIPSGFEQSCGRPVDREDLILAFHKVFKPSDNFLFYKNVEKEVYIVIVPLKYSTTISVDNESFDGDFQKHAISFLNEGSVSTDTLKTKLSKILGFCKFDK
jgi:hypothetical protein